MTLTSEAPALDEPSYGSLPPLTSPSAAIPAQTFDIDDSLFDSFGPLSFGLPKPPAAADAAPRDDAALEPETPAPPVFDTSSSVTRDIVADDPAAAPPTPVAPDAISPGILAPDDEPAPPAQHTPTPAAEVDSIALQFGDLSSLQFGELSFGNTPAKVVAETAAPCHPPPDPTPAQGGGGAAQAAYVAQDATHAPVPAPPAPAPVPVPADTGQTEGLLNAAFSDLDAAFPPLTFGNPIEPKEAPCESRTAASGADGQGDAQLGWQVSPVKQPLVPTPVRCCLRPLGLQ